MLALDAGDRDGHALVDEERGEQGTAVRVAADRSGRQVAASRWRRQGCRKYGKLTDVGRYSAARRVC